MILAPGPNTIELYEGMTPVSYTHLDVYKRQVLDTLLNVHIL